MKYIEKFLYHSAAYTVVISILFFIFAAISRVDELSISFSRYMLIFAFSLIISATEFIFSIKKLHVSLRYLIHYFVLCIGFFVVFLSVRSAAGNAQFSAATVFAGIIIFSLVYFLIVLALLLIKKVISKRTKGVDKKVGKATDYTPRFK